MSLAQPKYEQAQVLFSVTLKLQKIYVGFFFFIGNIYDWQLNTKMFYS